MEALAAIRTDFWKYLNNFSNKQAIGRETKTLSYPQFKVALIRLGVKLNEAKSREVFGILNKAKNLSLKIICLHIKAI